MRSRVARGGFWDDPDLGSLSAGTRLVFFGLWCLSDREGRLEDDARRIKARTFPYQAEANVEAALLRLADAGLIVRYEAAGGHYIAIPRFLAWTTVYEKEPESILPAPAKQAPTKTLPSDNANTRTRTRADTEEGAPEPTPALDPLCRSALASLPEIEW